MFVSRCDLRDPRQVVHRPVGLICRKPLHLCSATCFATCSVAPASHNSSRLQSTPESTAECNLRYTSNPRHLLRNPHRGLSSISQLAQISVAPAPHGSTRLQSTPKGIACFDLREPSHCSSVCTLWCLHCNRQCNNRQPHEKGCHIAV